MNITPPPDWHADGLCNQTDPDAFYPDQAGDSAPAARRVCATCPVQPTCLEDALDREGEYGVWGGMTARQRRNLLAARRRTTQHHDTTAA
ncbi:WhiB family transcriptional regulator [Saccharothrix stipae]